jgi:hypothetical protein
VDDDRLQFENQAADATTPTQHVERETRVDHDDNDDEDIHYFGFHSFCHYDKPQHIRVPIVKQLFIR